VILQEQKDKGAGTESEEDGGQKKKKKKKKKKKNEKSFSFNCFLFFSLFRGSAFSSSASSLYSHFFRIAGSWTERICNESKI